MRFSGKKAILISTVFAVVTIGIYMVNFTWFEGYGLSPRPEDWGYFGSYIAGTIGVFLALATVWMLAETLRLQRQELALTREELSLTRDELAESSKAQKRQAELLQQTSAIDQIHYLTKQIEENIAGFLEERYGNDIRQPSVKIILQQKRINSDVDDYQLKAISVQFAFLVSILLRSEHEEYFNIIYDIIQSIVFKHRAALTGLCDFDYFAGYRSDIKDHVLALIWFDDKTLMA